MKVTVTINNYNYSRFLKECVDSVLSQSYRDYDLVVVDDGSTDDSLEVLNKNYKDKENVKIITKENAGQLSAFNAALNHLTGEVVFFLDADDVYKPNYLEEIVEIYKNNKDVDFVFCAKERFFNNGEKEIVQKHAHDKKYGFSAISALYAKEWVGSPTSAISMRRSVLNKILPLPFENEWITRADDCLIWGSSIVGANKYYSSNPLVMYRVHGDNHFYNKKFSNFERYKRELSANKFLVYLKNKFLIDDSLLDLIVLEYRSRNSKDKKILKKYLKIILRSNRSFLIKRKSVSKLLREFFKNR